MNKDFERNLKEILQSSASVTGEIGGYILDSGGKRLRPRMVELVGKSIGLAPELCMSLAYTVELMHTASLLHDDVVDGTEIRRSRPTANQVFGDKPALLTGDFISASAMELMCTLGNLKLALHMVQTIKRMAEGELKELEHARAFHDRLDVYLSIIYLKTASLFEFCTLGPAILADLPEKELDALANFGRFIGMGFQIVDDIINVSPNEGDNKDAFNDIIEGKSTLPLIILFRQNPEALCEVASFADTAQKKDYLVSMLTPEILRKSRDVARDYLGESIEAIRSTGYLTPDLAAVPDQIMAQVDERF
ncbi:MAG: polyprenyl synthetase family protein [Syntrophaceae bacterium]|nr:polyprenyl synthetase family protein [Deltaproteobacteria bacterium]